MTSNPSGGSTSKMAWVQPGIETVVEGVHRTALPLPMDALVAVNVYIVEGGDGLLLIDGGWSIPEARVRLDEALAQLGYAASDIAEIVVTHAHRDHYTMAAALKEELGCRIRIGAGEQEYLGIMQEDPNGNRGRVTSLARCGAPQLQDEWERWMFAQPRPTDAWGDPTGWLHDGEEIRRGPHLIRAIETSGHTRGHFVFADEERGLLFSGDHILPTITPSVAFEPVDTHLPLRNYLHSLKRILELPDMQLLPAHGPVGMSSHARAQELLDHHDVRLSKTLDMLRDGGTAYEVASKLRWMRRELTLSEMEPYNAVLAIFETELHLDLLEARGEVYHETDPGGAVRYHPAPLVPGS